MSKKQDKNVFEEFASSIKTSDAIRMSEGIHSAEFDGFVRNSKIKYEGLSSQDALWKACRFNDYEMVKEALDEGANPNIKKNEGPNSKTNKK